MGRGVEVPSDALLTVYAHWEDNHTSVCGYCDEQVKRDWDGGPIWVEEGSDGNQFCAARNAELQGNYDLPFEEFYEEAVHEGWDYDSDNFQNDLEWAKESMMSAWPSLVEPYSGERPDSLYYSRETEVILENGLVLVTVSEYCGVVALSIVGKGWMTDMLAAQWVSQIAPKFEEYFGDMKKIATASNGETFYETKEA